MRDSTATSIVALLVLSTVLLAVEIHPVNAEGTIYIRADGSIDPPTASITTADNVTYTLVGNIVSGANGIVVERDSIVLDGAGYTLQGSGNRQGIDLTGRTNVTVRNIHVTNFGCGIRLAYALHSNVSDNTLTANNDFGIHLDSSSHTSLSSNTIAENWYGIWLSSSSHTSIQGNNLTANEVYGIMLVFSSNASISGNTFTHDGLYVWGAYQNSVESNTVNGRPLVYLEGVSNHTVEDAGQVILVRCTNIKVDGLNLSRTSVGIELWETDNATVSGNTTITYSWEGIRLFNSSGSHISGNTITNNSEGIRVDSSSYTSIIDNVIADNTYGVGLDSSSHTTVNGNAITNNRDGIHLYFSSHTNISGNIIANNTYGIGLSSSSDTIVSSNTVADNWHGIGFYYSDFNSVNDNIIADNTYGIGLSSSSNNLFYHNNIIGNNQQVNVDSSGYANTWDNGYPAGGNYWSGYTDADDYKGAHQNETDSDGVWDHPYVIDAENQDRYPLAKPFGGPAGDVDGDGDVDLFDIVKMASAYGAEYPDPRYDRLCDVNLDGDVDLFDIVAAAANYGRTYTQ